MTRIPPFRYDRKEGRLTDIKGNKVRFDIVDHVALRQSTYPQKMFVLEKIRFQESPQKRRKEEIRIGYYIIGKKERMKGRWVWGQFCPFFPPRDLEKLIVRARKKRII